MSACTFTAADVIAKVRELAAANPDFVYTAPPSGFCKNVVKGEDGTWVGSCIVGQAVVALGVPAETIADHLLDGADANTLLRAFEVSDITDDQRDWVAEVQANQDRRNPWAQAIASADELVNKDGATV